MKNAICIITLCFSLGSSAGVIDSTLFNTAAASVMEYARNWGATAKPVTLIIGCENDKATTISVLFQKENVSLLKFNKYSMLGLTVNLMEQNAFEVEKFSESQKRVSISVLGERVLYSPLTVFDLVQKLISIYQNKYPNIKCSAMLNGERLGIARKMSWYFSVSRTTDESRKFPLNFFVNAENLDISQIFCSDIEIKDGVMQYLQPFEYKNGFYNLDSKH